jgi:hypothetical protein
MNQELSLRVRHLTMERSKQSTLADVAKRLGRKAVQDIARLPERLVPANSTRGKNQASNQESPRLLRCDSAG